MIFRSLALIKKLVGESTWLCAQVVITKDGCRVLTCVPRTVAEIEATMAGAEWQASDGEWRPVMALGEMVLAW